MASMYFTCKIVHSGRRTGQARGAEARFWIMRTHISKALGWRDAVAAGRSGPSLTELG